MIAIVIVIVYVFLRNRLLGIVDAPNESIPFESMATPDLYREYVRRQGFRPCPHQNPLQVVER